MQRKDINFTALDTETMTSSRFSLCAIGIVRVVNGYITQKFYSLVKPIETEGKPNTLINGISEEMVENAPTFKDLWPEISKYITGQTIVVHAADFDLDVLEAVTDYYGIKPDYKAWVDTYRLENLSLAEACKLHGIDFHDIHDTIENATVTAKYQLEMEGMPVPQIALNLKDIIRGGKSKKARELSSDAKKPLTDDEIENKDTPFYHKKIVITGLFNSYPERETLAELLKKYGADINSSISSKTNIVIIGKGAGPSKMKKIEELKEKGIDIETWSEYQLLETFKHYGIK